MKLKEALHFMQYVEISTLIDKFPEWFIKMGYKTSKQRLLLAYLYGKKEMPDEFRYYVKALIILGDPSQWTPEEEQNRKDCIEFVETLTPPTLELVNDILADQGSDQLPLAG